MIFLKGELFNGPGGLALGAKNAGFVHPETGEEWKIEHLWSNDYDSTACETYRNNICEDENDKSVHEGPVEALPIGDRDVLGNIDCFAFGFPCNSYSQVGKKEGLNDEEFGPLYSYGVRVLELYQPKFFVAENVGGLQSANQGKAFIQILTELEDSGYQITPHLYKFEEYGIPQARHRIIIVGIRNDLAERGIQFRVPAPTTLATEYRTSQQAIIDPPIAEGAPNHEMPRHTSRVKKMLSYIPAGENAWYPGIPEELRLNVKGARLSSIYKRLDPERPAYTVTGSGGGGTHMYHWSEPRALTNRERARLQTFPDDFVFHGNREAIRRQIGMAVPPEGAEIIFNAILKTFAGIDYESVEPLARLQLENLTGRPAQTALTL